ncbi:MAG: peptidase signal peptidase [Solirubrobacterales bacterium]|nr:peptidase signal peptidase [Solirubrobacterales bacterium]
MPQPASSSRRTPAWLDRGLTVLIVVLAVALAVGVGLRAFGLTALVDYTDSMQPAIAAGDVVIDESVPARELRAGQIASIADPGSGGRLITHRVVSVTPDGDRVAVVTRGDANDASERWVLAADAPTRRMVARLPWVGHLVAWLASPLLRTVLMLLAAGAFGLYGLRRLARAS